MRGTWTPRPGSDEAPVQGDRVIVPCQCQVEGCGPHWYLIPICRNPAHRHQWTCIQGHEQDGPRWPTLGELRQRVDTMADMVRRQQDEG